MEERIASAEGREYLLRIHVPQGVPPPGGHPLLWLLDLPTTWAPMQQALGAEGAPAAIVIGIGWPGDGPVDVNLRRRDFTRPALHAVPPPAGADEDWREDGDADAFRFFLTGVLQPHYVEALPADPGRQTLVGHSLSALFALQALLTQPTDFQRYVAASPSLWWDQVRLPDEAARSNLAALQQARVLLCVGSAEQVEGPEKPPEVEGGDAAAMLGERHMVANARAFADLLRAHGVDCGFELVEGASHHSVLPEAMAAALAFACAPAIEPAGVAARS